MDHQVTCAQNGSPVTCPSETTPTIAVQTSFSSPQAIIGLKRSMPRAVSSARFAEELFFSPRLDC